MPLLFAEVYTKLRNPSQRRYFTFKGKQRLVTSSARILCDSHHSQNLTRRSVSSVCNSSTNFILCAVKVVISGYDYSEILQLYVFA